MTISPDFEHLLNQLENGKLKKADYKILHRLLLDSQYTLATGERAIALGYNDGDAVLITGDHNIVRVLNGANAQIVRKIVQEELLQHEQESLLHNHHNSIQKYLKSLVNYCNKLSYFSLRDIYQPKSLDEIYIPIEFVSEEHQNNRKEQKEKNENQDESIGIKTEDETLFLPDILRIIESHNILIVGMAGAGKSTILRQIAKYACLEPEKVGLDKPYLPLLLSLRSLANSHATDIEGRIREALSSTGILLAQNPPNGFFEDWPTYQKREWLLLLDGLDEVPDEDNIRASLIALIRTVLEEYDFVRMVITCRLSGYKPDELDDEHFMRYNILPFNPNQTGKLATRWFGTDAATFLQALDNVSVGVFHETPLLLTIAAKVYRHRQREDGKGKLPANRTELYEEAVDILLGEAKSRGLTSELNQIVPGLANIERSILGYLAWEMSQKRYHIFTEDDLAQKSAEFLRQEFNNLGKHDAAQRGLRFVQVMGQRSGILVRNGKNYDWLHQTFLEYLTGCHIVEEKKVELEMETKKVPISIGFNWTNSSWDEKTLFGFDTLLKEGKDTTAWIKAFYNMQGPLEAGKALLKRGKVDSSLVKKIVDEIVEMARTDWREGKSVKLLKDLCPLYSQAKDGFLTLIYDEELTDGSVRSEGIISLGQSGYADEILELALDTQLHPHLRKDAAMALIKMSGQTDKAGRACLALAKDDDLDSWYPDNLKGDGENNFYQYLKLDVAKALGKLPGWIDEASMLILEIARNEKSYFGCSNAIKALGEMSQYEVLRLFVQDVNSNFLMRALAIEQMLKIELFQMEYFDPLWLDMIINDKWNIDNLVELIYNKDVDTKRRFWAVLKIIPDTNAFIPTIDEAIEIAQSVVYDPHIKPTIRDFAAELLEKLPKVLPSVLESIHNNEGDLENQLDGIRLLALAQRTKDLFELAQNEQMGSEIRSAAMINFMQIDNTPKTRWAVAQDEQMDLTVRQEAVLGVEEIIHSSEAWTFIRDEQMNPWLRFIIINRLWEEILYSEPETLHHLSEVINIARTLENDQLHDNSAREFLNYILQFPQYILEQIKIERNKPSTSEDAPEIPQRLASNNYPDDVFNSLGSFISDDKKKILYIVRLAEMLAHMDHLDDALQTLISLVHDTQIDSTVLANVFDAMGRIGDARCLPILEHIVDQHTEKTIRIAATNATQKIRQR